MSAQYQGDGLRAVESPNLESPFSGTSWGAVFAGGFAAAGISLILFLLGSGLGFSAVSPWASESSMSAGGLAVAAGIWLVIQSWIAAIFGGYVAGRLRTKWADHHSDEVYFRDSAHGFLAWGVATFMAVSVSVLAGMTAVGGAAATAGAAASQAGSSDAMAYATDQLFRMPADGAATTAPVTTAQTSDDGGNVRTEGGMLLGRAVLGTGNDGDTAYLGQLVSRETGLPQAEADARVQQVVNDAKAAADAAREASAYTALISALALLVGAFIAAVAGVLGGRHRDELEEVSRR